MVRSASITTAPSTRYFNTISGSIGGSIGGTTGIFNDVGGTITTLVNTGTISGVNTGLKSGSSISTLTNSGTISSTNYYGVNVTTGGTIATVINDGTITSPGGQTWQRAFLVSGGSVGTLTNNGLIQGFDGIYMPSGSIGTIVNSSTGTISGLGRNVGILVTGGQLTDLSNSGSIGNANLGIGFGGVTVATLTNNGGGAITGNTAISNGGGATIQTLTNAGLISGTRDGINNSAVIDSFSNSGTLTGSTYALLNTGSIGGTITNSGVIIGSISSSQALTFAGGTGGTVGTFAGLSGSVGNINSSNGVNFASGAVLLNDNVNVGSNTVTNSAATVQINNRVTVTGNYTQSTSAELVVGVTSAASYGELVASSNITLTNDTIAFNPLNGFTLTTGQVYTLAAATGSLSASGVTVTLPSGFGDTVSVTGNDLILTITQPDWPVTIGTTGPVTLTGSNAPSGVGSITSSGTITGTTGVIVSGTSATALINSGLISVTGVGVTLGTGVSLPTITNNTTIAGATGINNAGTVTTLSNSGAIIGAKTGLINSGTIGTLINSGTISGNATINTLQGGIYNTGSIDALINTIGGMISSPSRFGIVNGSIVNTLTNNGTIRGTNNSAIANTATIGTLTNSGTIAGSGAPAISNKSGGGSIGVLTNTVGGLISGYATGVANGGTIGTLSNSGTISAASYAGVVNRGDLGTLTNTGTITGTNYGLYDASTGTIGTLGNSGSINVVYDAGLIGGTAVAIGANNSGSIGTVTIASGGTISGGASGIHNANTITAVINSGLIYGGGGGNTGGIYNPGSNIGTIVNNSGGSIVGANDGIWNNGGSIGSISNSGYIDGNGSGGPNGTGGIISTGTIGTIVNNGGGTITGADTGIYNAFAGHSIGLLSNSGTITGATYAILNSGTISTINNTVGGVILGRTAIGNGSGSNIGTLTNSGKISGTIYGIKNVGTIVTINNAVGGSIGGPTAIYDTGTVGTLTNSGTINGTAYGVSNAGSIGMLNNTISGTVAGTIPATNAIAINNTGTVGALTNSGTITSSGGPGISNKSGGGSIGVLTNTVGGLISGYATGLANGGTLGTLSNSGVISAASFAGVVNRGDLGTLTNAGTITGGGNGVYNASNGTIGTLGNSGSISALANLGIIGGGATAIKDTGAVGTLSNSGTITGGTDGIYNNGTIATLSNLAGGKIANTATTPFSTDGAIFNFTGSSIGMLSNAGSIGGNSGVYNQGAIGTLFNSGTITGLGVGIFDPLSTSSIGLLTNTVGGTISGVYFGVSSAGTMGALINNGMISSQTGMGVDTEGSLGTLNNTGTITGRNNGVYVSGSLGSLTNFGVITGSLGSGVYNNGSIGILNNSGSISAIGNGGTIGTGATGIDNTAGGTIGALTNSATIAGTSFAILNNGAIQGTIVNSGVIEGAISSPSQGLTFAGGATRTIGTIIRRAVGTFTGSTGALTSVAEGLITAPGLTLASGNILFNDNVSVGSGTFANTGANVQINNAISITGNYTQSTLGLLAVGASSAASYGELVGSGAINLAGDKIDFDPLGTFTPTTGQVYTLAAGGSLTASGVSVVVPSGFGDITSIVSNDLLLTVVAWPVTTSLTGAVTLWSGNGSVGTSGAITGGATGVPVAGAAGTLTNQGLISGSSKGVSVGASGSLGGLNNSGTISGTTGVNNAGTLTSIVNSGTISGTANAIASAGSLGPITNSGLIAGNLTVGGTRDLTIAGGTGRMGTLTGSDRSIGAADAGAITAHGVTFSTGTLLMNDNIAVNSGTGLVTNVAETLQLNNPVSITGNYTQNSTATLVIGVTLPTSYGELVASGNINLAGDNITIAPLAGPPANEVLTVAAAGGSLSAGGVSVTVPAGYNDSVSIIGQDLVVTLSYWPVINSITAPHTLSSGTGSISPTGTISGTTGVLVIGTSATALTNSGLVSVTGVGVTVGSGAGLPTLSNSATVSAGGTGISNSGSIGTLTNASTGTISGKSLYGVDNNSTGTIGVLINSGTITGGGLGSRVRDGLFNNGGSIGSLSNSGSIIGGNYGIYNNGTINTLTNTVGGLIHGGSNSGLRNTGTIGLLTNSGTISGGSTGVSNNSSMGTLTNSGIIIGRTAGLSNYGPLSLLSNTGTITGATGLFNANPVGSLSNAGTISGSNFAINNTGTILGTITNSGLIAGNIASGQALTFAGGTGGTVGTLTGYDGSIGTADEATITSSNGLTLASGAMLLNDNVNVGSAVFTNAGTLQVNNPLSITGKYAQSSNALLVFGYASPSSYGELVGSGNVNLAGDNIALTTLTGGTLTNGEVLTLVAAGTLSASGVSVTMPAGFNDTVSLTSQDLILTVYDAPWPTLSTSVTGPATLNGGSGLVTPHGTITGGPTGVLVNGPASSLTNQGLISATGAGVSITSAGSLGGLNNSGTIAGGSTGVNNGGTLTSIVNSGTISGSANAIASAGSLGPITNSGLIAGNVTVASPQDLTIAGGTGTMGTLTGSTGSIGLPSEGTITAHGVTFNTGTLLVNDNIVVNGGAGSVSNTGERLQVNNPVSITGSYTQSTLGALVIGVTSPTSYGELVASGSVNLAGDTVSIIPTSGGALANGEVLTIVAAGTLSASGVSVTVPTGFTDTTSIIGNDLVVTVKEGPWPTLSSSITGPATLNGASGLVTGTGAITGGPTGVAVVAPASSLTNQGLISATGAGISIAPAGSLGGLNNSGMIAGATGVNNAGTLTSIVNSGTISGSANAIASTGSLGPITNSGLIAGNITATPQDLTIAGASGTVGNFSSFGTLTGSTGSISAADEGTITAHGVTFNTGTLVMNDNIVVNGGSGTVFNTGETLGLANPVTITGNYTQSTLGQLVLGVTSPTSYGELVATGNINLAGDSVSIVPINGGSLVNDEVLTIVAAGSLSAAGVSVAVPAGFTESASIIGNDLVVTLYEGPWPTLATTITSAATLNGGTGLIAPTGKIAGGPTGVLVTGQASSLTNQGLITVSGAGVSISSAGSLGGLNNSGTIAGATGVKNAGILTSIVNSGTISGSANAIASGGSLGPITNSGLIAGNVTVTSPQDLTIAGGPGSQFSTLTGASGSINAAGVGNITAHGVTFSTGVLVMNDNITVNGGAGSVTNVAETLGLANPVTITGNYTQSTLGALVIGVTSSTSYGELVASGNINLAGDSISITPINGGTLSNDEILTIAAAGGVLSASGVSVSVPTGFTDTTTLIGQDLVVTIASTSGSAWPVVTPVPGEHVLPPSGGTVTPSGTISGGSTGVTVSGSSTTLTNQGSISGSIAGVHVGSGSTLLALDNTGTISSTGGGTVTGNGGAVANTGSISSLTNTGNISGTGGATIGGVGVLNSGTVGTLGNGTGGMISGQTAAVQNQGTLGGLSNSSTLTSQAPTGIHNATGGTIGTVTNSGTISGNLIGLNNSGSLSSLSNTGTITGTGGGTVNGNDAAIVNKGGSIGSLSNSGFISGTGGATIGGIGLLNGNTLGSLSNSGGGVLSGMTAAVQNQGSLGGLSNSSTISSQAPTGIGNFAGSTIGTLSNTGTITGSNIGLNNAGTIGTLLNAGLIDPPNAGVNNTGSIAVFNNPGTVSSTATALANSGIIGTLLNSGTLTGATAVNNSGSIGGIGNTGLVIGNVVNSAASALTISGASGNAWGTFVGANGGSATLSSPSGFVFSGGNILLEDNVAVGSKALSVTGANVQLVRPQTISGNYAQSGGSLVIGVTNAANYGSFTVSGTANVSNTMIDLVGGGFARGQKYAIVDARGGGTYLNDTATITGPSSGLTPAILVTPDILYVEFPGLTYQQIGAAYDPVAGNIGATLDRIAVETTPTGVSIQNSILYDINNLPTTEAQGAAIRQLAPVQIAPAALAAGNAVLASGAVEQHQLTTAYLYPGDNLEVGSGGYDSAAWGQMLGGGTSRSATTDAEGYDTTNFGVAAGLDHQFTANIFAGASFGWVHSWANATAAQSGQKLNADSYLMSLYGTWRNGPMFVNAQVTGGWDDFHQERPINFLGARASANYSGEQILGRASTGYDVRLGSVTLTPMAGFTWQRSWTDAYTETGAARLANLSVDGHGVGTIEQDIGVKLNSAFKTSFGTLVLELRGEWLHDYTQGLFPTSGIFGDQPFTVGTARPAHDGALITYGVTLNRDDNMSIRIEGRSDVRSDYQSHSGIVKVIFGF